MAQNKRKRRALIALTVLVTLLWALAILGAVYAGREMRHEGLTYSQWYEDSVDAWYRALVLCVLTFGAVLCCLAALLGAGRRLPRCGPRGRKLLWGALALGLAGFCFFALRAGQGHRLVMENRALQTESLEPFLRFRGRNALGALVCLETAAALLWALKKRRQAEEDSL